MADITITAADVRKGTNPTVESGTAAVALTAGQSVYKRSSDSKWALAQADGTAEEAGSGGVGIALHATGADQPIQVQTAGPITIGAAVVAGTEYVVSATAGGIAPKADLVSTNRYTRLGYATTTAIIQMDVRATGITLA